MSKAGGVAGTEVAVGTVAVSAGSVAGGDEPGLGTEPEPAAAAVGATADIPAHSRIV